MSLFGFNAGDTTNADSSDTWGTGSFGGILDVFTETASGWLQKVSDIDTYKRAKKAGLVPDYSEQQTTFGSGAGSASGVTDGFSDDFYKKAGLAVGVVGLLITVYVVFLRKG